MAFPHVSHRFTLGLAFLGSLLVGVVWLCLFWVVFCFFVFVLFWEAPHDVEMA